VDVDDGYKHINCPVLSIIYYIGYDKIYQRSIKMVSDDDKMSSVPVKLDTKTRLAQYKLPKKNRKKGEHVMETIDDLLNRLMDLYDAQSKDAV